jgi:hypothetical protein
MNNKMKIFLIVCAVVFLTGLAATVTGLALNGWRDLDKLPGDWNFHEFSGKTDNYTLTGNDAKFDAMDLNIGMCEVEYQVGDEFKIDLTYDEEMTRPDVKIENGTLKITTDDDYFISGDGNGFTMKLEITVPEGTKLSKADLTLDACQADFSNLYAKDLDVSFDVGELNLNALSFETARFTLNVCDVNIRMTGEADDYDYDIVNGLGSLTLDGMDIEKASSDNDAPYFYELDSDVCDVDITYQ